VKKHPRKSKTIVLDADGTCFEYTGWKSEEHVGRPIRGVVEFTRLLDFLGYDLVISTARTGRGLESIRAAVFQSGMAVKSVTNAKPIGIAYIDDRGIRFDGDWGEMYGLLAELLEDPEILTLQQPSVDGEVA